MKRKFCACRHLPVSLHANQSFKLVRIPRFSFGLSSVDYDPVETIEHASLHFIHDSFETFSQFVPQVRRRASRTLGWAGPHHHTLGQRWMLS
jgi:hypothetical protein